MTASSPFLLLSGGHLLVRADQMTALLRHVAAVWLQATDRGETDYDPATVLTLANGLMEVADQIDAECIALLPPKDVEPKAVEEDDAEDAEGAEGDAED
ncbi:hypothetical protein KV205_08555 [Streptomyces sp. SKN60]|uniref:DUF6213 family protein n=1 Tax=Streptomyces sp. SKN60 TaxID=2855506 RepID=UPI0022465482|nr:DUF6213 family protein [Streptomyces sp. SKN60]MCX2180574.1 hypothetical protein [Streptomyces sp. SKN60]